MAEFEPDPELLDLLDKRVRIEYDANYKGETKTARGGVVSGPYVTVEGLEDVPAYRFEKRQTVVGLDGRPVSVVEVRWLFASPVALDMKHYIVWTDPDRGGAVRYDHVKSPSRAPGGNNATDFGHPLYWAVETEEHHRPMPV